MILNLSNKDEAKQLFTASPRHPAALYFSPPILKRRPAEKFSR